MHIRPLHWILFVFLVGPLVLFSNHMHWGPTGTFLSVLVGLGTTLVVNVSSRMIVKKTRRALGSNREAATDFLFGPTAPVARKQELRLARQQVVHKTQVSEWAAPRLPLLPSPHTRPPLQPQAPFHPAAYPGPTADPKKTSPGGRLTLGPQAAMPLELSLTSALIVDNGVLPVAPVFVEEWVKLGLGLLLIDMHGQYKHWLAQWSPGFGFLAGSNAAQDRLAPHLAARYFPLTAVQEATAVGQGIVNEGLKVIFHFSSYSDPAEAGMMLVALLQGMRARLSPLQKPCAVLMTDAARLLPQDDQATIIADQKCAQRVYDEVINLLEMCQEKPGMLAFYLATSSLAALDQEAMEQSRLWIVNTHDLEEVHSICQQSGRSHQDFAALEQNQVVLFDNMDSATAPYVLQFRQGATILPVPMNRRPGRKVSAENTPPEKSTGNEHSLQPAETHQDVIDTPTTLAFSQAELSYASYLYATNRITPTAIRRPPLDLVAAAQAAGLTVDRDRDLMGSGRAKRLRATVLIMTPAERAEHAKVVRDALPQQQQQRGGHTGSNHDPPRDMTASGLPFWRLPGLSLLQPPDQIPPLSADELEVLASKVRGVLASHRVQAEVRIEDISIAPRIMRIGIRPTMSSDGKLTKVEQIRRLKDDLKLHLAVKFLRMESPVAGQAYVGIEIPHPRPSRVNLRELLESPEFKQAARLSKLTVALGKDLENAVCVANVTHMPHALIAGMTGSGKSILIHSITGSILMQATPDDVRFLMVDPKKTELTIYDGIPHLLQKIITDPEEAATMLEWAVAEMERRNTVLAAARVRNLDEYRQKRGALIAKGEYSLKENLPHIVIIIDELSHLMMTAPTHVEKCICLLAQGSRAAGIHLIVATQRPSVDVITGLIKANLPTRLACRVVSHHDSQTILDMSGAEELLGKGDILYLPEDAGLPDRLQGAHLTTAEAEAIANHWRDIAKGIPPNVIALPAAARKKSEALDTIQPPLEPSWSSEKPSLQSPPNDKTAQEQLKATGRLKDGQVSTYLKAFLDGDPLPFKLGDITDNDQLYRFIEAWTRNRTQISISLLQRVFNVGYVRASEFVSRLEKAGLVGEDPGGGKQRPVLLQHQEDAVDAGDQPSTAVEGEQETSA